MIRNADVREGGIVDFSKGGPTLLIEVYISGLSDSLAIAGAARGEFSAGRHLGGQGVERGRSEALIASKGRKWRSIGLNTTEGGEGRMRILSERASGTGTGFSRSIARSGQIFSALFLSRVSGRAKTRSLPRTLTLGSFIVGHGSMGRSLFHQSGRLVAQAHARMGGRERHNVIWARDLASGPAAVSVLTPHLVL